MPFFTSCSVVSPRNFVPLKLVLKKKNAHLKKDLHVALWLFWENESRSEELEEMKINSYMVRTPALEIYSKFEKEPGSRKEKKKRFFKHARVNGSIYAILFLTNNCITNFYPSP